MAAKVFNLGVGSVQLGVRGFDIPTESRFAKNWNAERALGQECSVRSCTADVRNAVIPIDGQGRKTLATICPVNGLEFYHLILKILIVLAVLIGNRAYRSEEHTSELQS